MCSYSLQRCYARSPPAELTALLQTSGLDFGERKGKGGKEKADGERKEKDVKGKGGEGEGDKRKGGRRKGKRNERRKGKGKGKGGFVCSCYFSLGKTLLGKSTDFSVQSLLHRSAVRQTHARHVRPKKLKT